MVRFVTQCGSRAFIRVSNAIFAGRSEAPKSVVFLGTPFVAANVLETLVRERTNTSCCFEVSTVVTQPSKPTGRKNRKIPVPSPVALKAQELGFTPEQNLLTPVSVNEEIFIRQLESLEPDLCVTAAYGNLLSERFLQIPRFGTLNIHPSLLPKYRGAAPVNRALLDGVTRTGVSIAFTVLELDAGPILVSEELAVDPDVQAPELLSALFERGTRLLIDALPTVFNSSAKYKTQKHELVTFAPKLKSSDSVVNFQSTATQIHNQVRALVPWPGTRAKFKLFSTLNSKFRDLDLKILETRVCLDPDFVFHQGVCFMGNRLFVQCGGDTALELLRVQRQGGKNQSIRDFRNGLGKRDVLTI